MITSEDRSGNDKYNLTSDDVENFISLSFVVDDDDDFLHLFGFLFDKITRVHYNFKWKSNKWRR